jgi:glutamine amidotransferase
MRGKPSDHDRRLLTSNLGSMQNMLNFGATSKIASAHDLEDATKIIVPGVGSFDAGMKNCMNPAIVKNL